MDPEKVLVTEGRSGMEKERISANYEQFPPFNYGSPFINLFQAAAASNLHHFLSPSLSNLSPQVAQNLFGNVINNNTSESMENNKDPNNTDDSILIKPDQTILNESMKRILEVVENSKKVSF